MARKLDFDQGEYKEAVAYFRQKINLPTKKWNDLEGAMHTRAFTVAGCMREDILSDFRNAVDAAISKGESLQDFRERFDDIAEKWRASDKNFDKKMKKHGYAGWRSKVIYQTNMLTAAAAAQERQVRDPDLKGVFTHAKYVCMMLPTSRDQHRLWNGTVLPVDHPWWDKHSPPNGFGCLCEKEFISGYEMQVGAERETKAPTPATDTTNIGENWDYSIGEADQGVSWASERAEVQDKLKKRIYWEDVPQKGIWNTSNNSSLNLPVETDEKFAPDETIDQSNFVDNLNKLFGKVENGISTVSFKDSLTNFEYVTRIDADFLADHLKGKGKARFANLPMYAETLKNPSEIRIKFMKSLKTGKSAIRAVFWKRFKYGKKNYFVEIVNDSGIGEDFRLYTSYANDDKAGKAMTGTVIYQKP